MQLSHVSIVGQSGLKNICIEQGRIVLVDDGESSIPAAANDGRLVFNNAIAFPGLVNSHDHLEFNLFPQLGNRVYTSYTEWGTDIHQQNKDSINRVLYIPLPLRIRWGLYKNLLNGITTVAHHGEKIEVQEDLVSVLQEADSWHSVSGEKGWRRKLINPQHRHRPVVIHIGEGTVPASFEEINSLLQWNVLRRELIGIHGVAMNEQQAASFRALVWCSASNYFLLNKTAAVDLLRHKTKMLFGTDSTLTASWNIWEHLRLARDQKMVSDAELFDMLTRTPSDIWGLPHSGSIEAGQNADIVVAEQAAGAEGWDAFYAVNPDKLLLVVHKGIINLFDGELLEQLNRSGLLTEGFYKVTINGREKYVRGDLPGLAAQIRQYHPSAELPVGNA